MFRFRWLIFAISAFPQAGAAPQPRVGDGELNEGQCREAFQFIAHPRLNHLMMFVDWNKQPLDGYLDEIICAFDLKEKFSAFGFDVRKVKTGG